MKRLFAAAAWLLLASCEAARRPEDKPPPAASLDTPILHAALENYAELAHAAYSDASRGARALLVTVDRLVAAPSAAGLSEARVAWLAARVPYQRSEVLRFYDGPVDQIEMRLNTWPIDEGYVDAAVGSGRRGIIDDLTKYPVLSRSLLSTLNAQDGETSISTGYHVIEYLLWGRDTRTDGPGERPHTDYLGGPQSPAARRGQYLHLAVEQLAVDLEQLSAAWAPGVPNNYRSEFLAQPPLRALAKVIKGMGSLSGAELAGERLTVAYETKAQENEHSCFSDSTHLDLVGDALGLVGVCLGRYERAGKVVVQGAGICDAIAAQDPKLADALRTQFSASVAALKAIPAPFDQAILGGDSAPGRIAILNAIHALEKQASTLSRVATVYDLRLSGDERARGQ